jgi:uncharacterized protein YbjT (DUF2867 family)
VLQSYSARMPVVVTGASGFIGRHAVPAFAGVSPEVRAFVRNRAAAPALREMGAKIAVGEITDADRLEVVMAGAHTVCHLVGGLNETDAARYEPQILGSLLAVLDAARRASVKRLLYLSYPGASPDSGNLFLRAKGLAEQAIAESGLQHVVIRCTHVYGPGSRWLTFFQHQARGRTAVVIGTGKQIFAPVHVGDVAAVLAAADDREGVVSGTWGLEGPDRITADELTDLLAGRRRHKFHVSPGVAAALGRASGGGYGRAHLEILSMDSLSDAPDAAAEFGVVRTPLAEGLRRSL